MLVVSLVVFQLIIFAVLVVIFRKLLTQNVSSATHHLEQLNQDFAKKENDLNKKLADIEKKSGEIVAKAEEEAEAAKLGILAAARKEKDEMIEAAGKQAEEILDQAEKTRNVLLSEIEARIQSQAVHRACELLEKSMSEDLKKDIHSQWIENLIRNGFENLDKRSIEKNVKDIVMKTAFPLSDSQKKIIGEKIKTFIGQEKILKEELDPGLIAGISLAIGSLVLDGSLRNRIYEQVKIVGHNA